LPELRRLVGFADVDTPFWLTESVKIPPPT
jgi:hypothetical protein